MFRRIIHFPDARIKTQKLHLVIAFSQFEKGDMIYILLLFTKITNEVLKDKFESTLYSIELTYGVTHRTMHFCNRKKSLMSGVPLIETLFVFKEVIIYDDV